VEDLREEIRKLELRVSRLTEERRELEELVADLQSEVSSLRYHHRRTQEEE
jgi:hypothetical protein